MRRGILQSSPTPLDACAVSFSVPTTPRPKYWQRIAPSSSVIIVVITVVVAATTTIIIIIIIITGCTIADAGDGRGIEMTQFRQQLLQLRFHSSDVICQWRQLVCLSLPRLLNVWQQHTFNGHQSYKVFEGTKLRVMERHMGSHRVTCHPSPALIPARRDEALNLSIPDGWKAELTCVVDNILRWCICLQTLAHPTSNRPQRKTTTHQLLHQSAVGVYPWNCR